MSPKIIFNPREEIRQVLIRWPYDLTPDQAIMAAANAAQINGEWCVQLPPDANEINITIVKAIR